LVLKKEIARWDLKLTKERKKERKGKKEKKKKKETFRVFLYKAYCAKH